LNDQKRGLTFGEERARGELHWYYGRCISGSKRCPTSISRWRGVGNPGRLGAYFWAIRRENNVTKSVYRWFI